MSRKPKNQDIEAAEEPDLDDAIDVAEGMEQVPSRMLNRMAGWKPHLRSILFLYHPVGSTRSTYHTLKRVLHYQPPIVDDAITIVGACMGVVRDALNAWPITSEKPSRWRLKAKLSIEGTEAYRHLDFEAGPDEGFWDSDDADEPAKQYKIATEMLEQSLELAIKATNALVRSGENFAKMGEAVTQIATGTATLAANAGAGFAQMMEVQAKMESERMAHEADMESQRVWAQTMEKFAPLIIGAIQNMNKPKGAASSNLGSPLAAELAEILEDAGVGWTKAAALLSDDARVVIATILDEATSSRGTDERVTDLVRALRSMPDWAKSGPAIMEALGPTAAMKLGVWISKCGGL